MRSKFLSSVALAILSSDYKKLTSCCSSSILLPIFSTSSTKDRFSPFVHFSTCWRAWISWLLDISISWAFWRIFFLGPRSSFNLSFSLDKALLFSDSPEYLISRVLLSSSSLANCSFSCPISDWALSSLDQPSLEFGLYLLNLNPRLEELILGFLGPLQQTSMLAQAPQ